MTTMTTAANNNTNNNTNILTRILKKISPAVTRENHRLAIISKKSDIIIKSYSEMSEKIKKEIDGDNISRFLHYEKQS